VGNLQNAWNIGSDSRLNPSYQMLSQSKRMGCSACLHGSGTTICAYCPQCGTDPQILDCSLLLPQLNSLLYPRQ
jgi:hypothetical protein